MIRQYNMQKYFIMDKTVTETSHEVTVAAHLNLVGFLDPGGLFGCQPGLPLPGFALAEEAIAKHDFLYDRVPGQGAIECPELVPFVSAGVGRRSDNPNHYVCREHRGVVSAYLKREYAEKATG